MKPRLVTAIVLLAIVLLFMAQNTTVVTVRMMFWQIAMPRYLMLFITLLIGVVIGWLTRAWYRTQARR